MLSDEVDVDGHFLTRTTSDFECTAAGIENILTGGFLGNRSTGKFVNDVLKIP